MKLFVLIIAIIAAGIVLCLLSPLIIAIEILLSIESWRQQKLDPSSVIN
ncbi:hypothetical protein [Ferruginibacter albus]|nr:hypothetical protein [Ferruginibacter albus]UAY52638.1 hypothetical protein K9M53_02845 [Ferruginibacter albus]